MTDTEGEDCGINPLQFRGWVIAACRWHDHSYSEESWQQTNMSRKEVDDAFLVQLLELSKKGDYRFAKRVASYAMYGVTRALGWLWWEGKK